MNNNDIGIRLKKTKNLYSKFFTFAICILILCLACSVSFAAKAKTKKRIYRPRMRIAVSNSFLYDVANFIIKPEIFSVRNIGNGTPGGSDIFITMTSNQKRFASRSKSLTYFATTVDYDGSPCEYDYYDSSKIPYIILNTMKAISAHDKNNYLHYQKRLAIYQSILDSTLQVGEKLLKNITLLDLTGHTGYILSSCAKRCVKPPKEVVPAWKNGDIEHLQATIKQANLRNMLIVTDFATDPIIVENVKKLATKHFHMTGYEGGSFSSYLAENFGVLRDLLAKQTEMEKVNGSSKTKQQKTYKRR